MKIEILLPNICRCVINIFFSSCGEGGEVQEMEIYIKEYVCVCVCVYVYVSVSAASIYLLRLRPIKLRPVCSLGR